MLQNDSHDVFVVLDMTGSDRSERNSGHMNRTNWGKYASINTMNAHVSTQVNETTRCACFWYLH